MDREVDIKEASRHLRVAEVTLYQQHQRGTLYGRHFRKVNGRLVASFKALMDEANKEAQEVMDKKIGVRFTDRDIEQLKRVAGPTPLATYIRNTVTEKWNNAN